MEDKNFFEFLGQYFDWIMFLLIIAGGYFQSVYLEGVRFTPIKSYDSTIKTLLVGTIFCAAYLAVLKVNGHLPKEAWGKYLLSYISATSFYQIILRPFNNTIIAIVEAIPAKLMALLGVRKSQKPDDNGQQ